MSILWSVAGFTLLFLATLTSCDNGRRMREIEERQLELRGLIAGVRDRQGTVEAMHVALSREVANITHRQSRNSQLLEALAAKFGLVVSP